MNLIERPLRLTFLTVMPSPYVLEMFEAMAADPRMRLRVCYMERSAVAAPGTYWDETDLPSYTEVLPGRWFGVARARVHVNPGVVAALCRTEPDVVVVSGYSALTCQAAMAGLRARGIPWVFWGELPGFERRGLLGRAARWLAQRPVAWWAHGVAGIGARAASAYQRLTDGRCPVHNIPYYCEMESFRTARATAPARQTGTHFLYCGQLIHRKGVDTLVEAFCHVAREAAEARLTLVGEGPLRSELEGMIPAEHRSRVVFTGFRRPADLPTLFAGADVFVLPSRHDGWGVVINQALAAGLPVIASHAVGAAEDLVRDGENGYVVPAGQAASLASAMKSLALSPERIAVFGRESVRRGEQLDPARGADRWYSLCQEVQGTPRDRSAHHTFSSDPMTQEAR